MPFEGGLLSVIGGVLLAIAVFFLQAQSVETRLAVGAAGVLAFIVGVLLTIRWVKQNPQARDDSDRI